MQEKLYGGNVTLQVFTTVETNDDLVQERNNAHLELDFDLFAELRKLVEPRGYYVQFIGADLHCIEDSDKSDIEFVSKKKAELKGSRKRHYVRIQL